ncbi:MAG TPA: peptide-N-glycosidase F-related protein [Bacteroidales bacterium]|nr:peptide-N-glycosidase F-related protein [Bacteroidales bacterium]
MARIFTFLFLFVTIVCNAQTPRAKHVITHNRTTIFCDPSTGTKSFVKWGVFPPATMQVRKVVMHLTLGSPDSLPTAHWDYLDRIRLLRKGGINGMSLGYELGRMLTPYGSIYGKGWSWKWDVDVTDFASFLRDSVEIEYTHTGYEDAKLGWALTLDFEFIPGPSVADFIGMTPLWNAGYKYGDPNEKIEEKIVPISYDASAGSAISRIRIQHTGHGMDRPKGCSEFCSRWRVIKVDDKIVDQRNMWKDCGGNPLYPQGGTWLYDRAYWCPGDLQIPDIIELPATPGKHTVSLEMEPYTATGNMNAVEQITAYMFQYSKPKQKVDVAIEKVLVPNDEQQFSRMNPAGFNPRFTIRNLGSENLRSVLVTYGTSGFAKQTFQWKGNLKFNETTDIMIPGDINFKEGSNTYTISLSKPNGGKDAWMGDNERTTRFTSPRILPTDFVLQFKTNSRPKDNRISVINQKMDTVFTKSAEQLSENTLYQDTLRLSEGKYELNLTDTAGDGLEFWAEPQNGDGYLRIFDTQGNLIHAFESDCGNGQFLSFIASSAFKNDTLQPKYAFSLYPRLVTTSTELNVVSNKVSNMSVIITVGGKVYEKHEYNGVKNASFSYNLSYLPEGRIVIEVLMDGVSKFKGRVNKSKI